MARPEDGHEVCRAPRRTEAHLPRIHADQPVIGDDHPVLSLSKERWVYCSEYLRSWLGPATGGLQ
jgi:hypothetical protein